MKWYPFSCELNITNHCNLNCYFCSMNSSRIDDFECYDSQNLEVIMEQLKRVKCLYISLSGGEPMTHPRFYEIARTLTENGFKVTMATNGILINDKSIVKIKEAGIKWIQISMHSISDEACAKIMGAPVQKKLLNAIDIVSRTEGIGLTVCIVKNHYNRNEIESIKSYLDDRGITYIFRDELFVGRLKEQSEINYEVLEERKIDLFQKYILNRESKYSKIRKFAILVNGDIVPCTELSVKLGNVYQNDLEEVWEKNKVIGLCKGCGDVPCLANYYHHNVEIREKVDAINYDSKQTYNNY